MADMVVDTGRTESFWVSYIKRRIKQNKNFIGLLTGQTGSGKSWSALSIAHMLNPDFDVRKQVIFKGKDFLIRVNEFKKKGVVIIWDEAGIDLSNRNWMSRANKTINFVIQTFRHQNFVLIFTVPYTDFIDKQTRRLFHAEMKTIGINYDDKTCKIKPQLIQYNQRYGKFYYKHLRVRKNKGGVVPLTFWKIPAPPKHLVDEYEDMKKEYTRNLNADILQEWEKDEKSKEKKNEEPDNKPEGSGHLTPLQHLVWTLMKQGKRNVEITKETGLHSGRIPHIKNALRKKGYLLEKMDIPLKTFKRRLNIPAERTSST